MRLENRKCDSVGFITIELLREWAPHEDTDFYICGPKPFMQIVHGCLQELAVNATRVRYEFFGPKEELQQPVAKVGFASSLQHHPLSFPHPSFD
ncbi:hypothetical protein SH528x_000576 [Novipirellula sp. SH528]|uniref:hypothetical protein n=1 Tax=Novipirellula sp. SH528 TaxID=3454466 RepID=UPI003F9FED67